MIVERVDVPTSGRLVLRITTRSSTVTVTAGEVDGVEVEAGSDTAVTSTSGTSSRGDHVEVAVTSRSDEIAIRCPEGADVVLGLSSGRVRLDGRFGDVRVTAKSGRVEIDEAASLDVRTSSGRVRARRCAGECRVMSRSGRVHIGVAGQLRAATKSGSITVDSVDAASVHTATGRIELGATGRRDVEIHAMSGSAEIAVAGTARPRLSVRTVSGSVRNDCEDGDDFGISVRTVSGSVSVVRG